MYKLASYTLISKIRNEYMKSYESYKILKILKVIFSIFRQQKCANFL